MSDQLTSAQAVSAPQTNTPAPQPPATPVSAPAPQQPAPQTDKQATPAPSKVNLHELPEFRQVQSQYEKQLAEERRKRQELEMRGMDDFEKLQYTNQQLQEQLGEYQRLVQEAQVMQQRQQALTDIATQTGAPITVLQDATDPDDAWRKAVSYMRAQLQSAPPAPPQAPPQVAAPNPWAQPVQQPQQPQWQPDLGGGAAATPQVRIEQEFAEAQKKGDPYLYISALRKLQEGQ